MSMLVNPGFGNSDARIRVALGPFAADSDADYSGYTVIGKYKAAALKAAGTAVRLTIQGYLKAGRSGTINNIFIGLATSASGGNAYDFQSAPTRITFGGGNSAALTAGASRISDEIAFTIDGARSVLIAYDVTAASFVSVANGLGTNFVMYRKAAVQEADDVAKTANYATTAGASPFLARLQCLS